MMSVTRFAFKLTDDTSYIDLAQCLSLVQRTMVRQKQVFTVLGGQIIDNSNTQVAAKISTAPNFWYVRASVNRAFKAWKDQRAQTLANANLDTGVGAKHVGKYADFKVTLNGVGSDSNVLPHFTGSTAVVPIAEGGEWATASVTDEAGSEKHFKIMGNHTATYYSATKGWLVTRTLPDAEYEPDMMDRDGDGTLDYKQDFLNLLNDTDDGQPERLTLLYEDNDNAPFAVRDMYGDVDASTNLQLQAFAYLNANNPSHMLPGFKALCGLIQVKLDQGHSNPILFLDVLNTPEAF